MPKIIEVYNLSDLYADWWSLALLVELAILMGYVWWSVRKVRRQMARMADAGIALVKEHQEMEARLQRLEANNQRFAARVGNDQVKVIDTNKMFL